MENNKMTEIESLLKKYSEMLESFGISQPMQVLLVIDAIEKAKEKKKESIKSE